MNGPKRRSALRRLEESEQRHRSLFEHNPDPVFSLDRQPRFTSANPAAQRISGYSLAELLDLPPPTLIVPEDIERTLVRYSRALEGAPSSDEIAITARDGHRVELALTLVPILVAGEIIGVYGMAKDITERRRVETERAELLLREQEARSRAEAAEGRAAFLADVSELLAASLDYETTLANLAKLLVPGLADWCAIDIIGENGTARRLVGATEPGLGRRVTDLLQRYPLIRGAGAASQQLMRVIQTGQPEFTSVVTAEMLAARATSPDQLRALQALEISSYMRVPLTARGHTLGAISFAYAVSGRRYAEADLALALELARRAALSVDNARLYQDAQRAIELRDEFLAAASHDLRTPITSIKGFAQLLMRTVSRAGVAGAAALSERTADLQEGLHSIDEAASRITAQIDELLDLSRLQSGRPLELRRIPTDLVALAQRLVDSHQHLTVRHIIHVEPERPELTGMWDGVRLERVLTNLLTNATKYSPEGGDVILTIRREETPAGPMAVLQVRDHGIGIPPADLPRIFERFYRATNVSGRPGSGIGLAGVRDIVRQHGGTIEVESEEHRGTLFSVRLPLDPPASENG